MCRITAIAAAVAALLAAGHALAAPAAEDRVSIQVSYADLDLSQASGRAALEARVQRAVDQVCPRAEVRELRRSALVEACRASVTTSARQQLAEVYANRQLAQLSVTVGPGRR